MQQSKAILAILSVVVVTFVSNTAANGPATSATASPSHAIANLPSKHPISQALNQAADLIKKVDHHVSTSAPNAAVHHSTKADSGAANAKVTSKPTSGGHCNDTPVGKFCKYLSPVCDSQDKMKVDQLTRLQKQLKQFIEKSNGKLGICFAGQYGVNPALSPIKKEELGKMCASRSHASDAKGSYGQFEKCASSNWDAAVEKELDRIIAARVKSAKNQKDGNAAVLSHEEDVNFLNDVVGSILDSKTGGLAPNTDVKMIDFSKPANNAAAKSSINVNNQPTVTTIDAKSPNGVQKTQEEAAKMMNDPNTMVVLVDDSTGKPSLAQSGLRSSVSISTGGSTTTTSAPSASHSTSAHPASKAADVLKSLVGGGSTGKPMAAATTATTQAPAPAQGGESLGEKIMAGLAQSLMIMKPTTTGAPNAQTTAKPTAAGAIGAIKSALGVTTAPTSTTAHPSTTASSSRLSSDAGHSTGSPSTTTTGAPTPKGESKIAASLEKAAAILGGASSTKGPATTSKAPQAASSTTTTKAPSASKSSSLTSAPKGTTTTSTSAKPSGQSKSAKDEIQSAIKALKATRDSGHKADGRLHQLEHERQMSIDPIGHTLKHQQYALSQAAKTTKQ